jgi:hypothetical protein
LRPSLPHDPDDVALISRGDGDGCPPRAPAYSAPWPPFPTSGPGRPLGSARGRAIRRGVHRPCPRLLRIPAGVTIGNAGSQRHMPHGEVVSARGITPIQDEAIRLGDHPERAHSLSHWPRSSPSREKVTKGKVAEPTGVEFAVTNRRYPARQAALRPCKRVLAPQTQTRQPTHSPV